MRAALTDGLAQRGLTLTDRQVDQFCEFGRLLIEKNQVMNLTAITEPTAVAQLHFLDSLAVLQAADCRGKTVIDVGCGAGFPGVPMAIAEPTAQVTLLDSLQKRMNWLKEILPGLGVERAAQFSGGGFHQGIVVKEDIRAVKPHVVKPPEPLNAPGQLRTHAGKHLLSEPVVGIACGHKNHLG